MADWNCSVCEANGISTPATTTDYPVVGDVRDMSADPIALCKGCAAVGEHYPEAERAICCSAPESCDCDVR